MHINDATTLAVYVLATALPCFKWGLTLHTHTVDIAFEGEEGSLAHTYKLLTSSCLGLHLKLASAFVREWGCTARLVWANMIDIRLTLGWLPPIREGKRTVTMIAVP